MRGSSTGVESRRERSARIEQVALELFRSRGFDKVTVEEVCAAAEVGPATFYRHFGTKEGVVFAYREGFTTALRKAVDGATGLPEGQRLPAILGHFAAYLESQSQALALRDAIVLGHPRLLERTLAVQRDIEAELAEGLSRLRGVPEVDATARIEAGLGLLVLRNGLRAWRTEGGALTAAVDSSLAEIRGVVHRTSVSGSGPDRPEGAGGTGG